MIKVEGYKAFHGLMRIESKSKHEPVGEIEGDWLYKPHTNTWHCNDISYPAKICTVVRDDSEKHIPKKPKDREGTTYSFCPCCGSNNIYEYCGDCGQALDWSDV